MLMSDPNHPEVVVDVHEAATPLERAKGLLGSPEVGAGKGLLLRSKQVHTIGMSFTIDTVHLRRDGTVLKVRTLKPRRLGPLVPRARWVLELDEGEAARLGIRPGIRLVAQ